MQRQQTIRNSGYSPKTSQPFNTSPRGTFPQGRLGLPQLAMVSFVGLLMTPFIIASLDWRTNGYIALGLILVAMFISVVTPNLRRVVMVLSVLASLRYIYWRATHTISLGTWGDIALTSLLFAAEIYGVSTLLLGYFQTVKLVPRLPEPLPADETQLPTVDIFIPTLNEDLTILRRTATCAVAIGYPKKKVYLLDDGHRESVKALAAEVGCGYITRNDNRNAKAGNINHALQLTRGELILILDADHVPVRSFLSETVGFFSDPKVALVQTPHHFFNPDPFQRNLSVEDKIAPEGDFFYHVVQVGNDYWNSAFFCGSAGIIRRSALEEIGGIATETVTEDAHTSLRIHARGYKSVYYSKPLVAGLATERFSYHVGQRIRWARGMIQILRIQNPLWTRGLTLPQRLNYFNAMAHFMFGIPRLIFILAPITYLLFGLHPVTGWGLEVLLYAMPHIVLATIAASMVSGNFRHSFWSEIYETAIAAFVVPVTLLALISPKLGKFNVTKKGGNIDRSEFDLRHAAPTIILTILALISMATVPYKWLTSPLEHSSIIINSVWTFYNLIILSAAVIAARDKAQERSSWRITREHAATVLLPNRPRATARLLDLSETGAKLILDSPVALHNTFDLKIDSDFGESTIVPARIIWQDSLERGRVMCGVEFHDVSTETRHSLIRLMFSSADTWKVRTIPADRPFRSYFYIMTSLFRTGSSRSRSTQTLRPRVTPTTQPVREFTPRVVSPTLRTDLSQPLPQTQPFASQNGNGNGHVNPLPVQAAASVQVISPTLRPAVVERFKVKPIPAPSDFQLEIMPVLPKNGKPETQVIANRRNRTYYRPGSDYYRMMTAARPNGDENWVLFASESEARSAGYAQQ